MINNNEMFLRLLENASDSITIRTVEGRIIEANPAACGMFDCDYDDLLAKNFMDLIPRECHGKARNVREIIIRDGFADYEIFFCRGDGSRFRAEARCVLIHNKNQDDVVMCISRDVTSRKEMMQALDESVEKYRLIVETANEGILASDGLQRINYVNEKVVDLLGYNVI